MPVTATSLSGTAPTVEGMMSSRSAVRAAFDARVGSVALGRDRDARDRLRGVGVDVDRLVHDARRKRAPFQLADGVAYGRRLDVRRLDDDGRCVLLAGVGRLDAVVGSQQLLRIRVDARLGGLELERGHRDRDEQAAGQ